MPDKCDVHEPVRERFDPGDLREPVRWLSQPGGQFAFRRNRPPRVRGFISNERFREIRTQESKGGPWIPMEARFPEPLFLTHWAVWLDGAVARKRGTAVLKRFLVQMFEVSMSEYGFLTTEDDHKKKNFLVIDEGDGTTESYVGTDPEKGVPGIYWMNLFGPAYANWLGRTELQSVVGIHEPLPNGSVFLQFGDAPETCSSPEILRQQREAANALGEDKFFDIQGPERHLRSPLLSAR